MLDLVRLCTRRIFPPGGEDLYRQIARLTGMTPKMELLDVACGKGIPAEYFVREFGVHATGVEEDPHLIAEAEEYAREVGLSGKMSFQQGSSADLPFRDETFDVVVGELGMAARVDPGEAIRELARVTRKGGQIVLVHLVWKALVPEDRRAALTDHLGARPLMLVELRRVLQDAEVEDLQIEDWTDEETAFRPKVKKPFPDFAELFTLGEKLGILRRAWGRWGGKGVRTLFRREAEVHRLLTKERILGLTLVKGVKAQPLRAEPNEVTGPGEILEEEGGLETAGLPLFGIEGEDTNPGA